MGSPTESWRRRELPADPVTPLEASVPCLILRFVFALTVSVWITHAPAYCMRVASAQPMSSKHAIALAKVL